MSLAKVLSISLLKMMDDGSRDVENLTLGASLWICTFMERNLDHCNYGSNTPCLSKFQLIEQLLLNGFSTAKASQYLCLLFV